MASRLTSAAQGASKGAQIGALTPLGPAMGGLVGAGVGAIGGALMGGETDAERMQRERMEELMRRQEMGQLGMTDQEINVALNQAQGALSQQQQAQRAQQAGLLATTGVGAGASMRAAQEEASQERREMADARQRVEELDVAQKRAEEQELQALGRLEQQRAAQEKEAMLGALQEGITAIDRAKQLDFLQTQALDERTQREKRIEDQRKAQAEAQRQARLAAQGNRTNEQIRSSPTTQFGSTSDVVFQQTAADVSDANMSTQDFLSDVLSDTGSMREESEKFQVFAEQAAMLGMRPSEYMMFLRRMR